MVVAVEALLAVSQAGGGLARGGTQGGGGRWWYETKGGAMGKEGTNDESGDYICKTGLVTKADSGVVGKGACAASNTPRSCTPAISGSTSSIFCRRSPVASTLIGPRACLLVEAAALLCNGRTKT